MHLLGLCSKLEPDGRRTAPATLRRDAFTTPTAVPNTPPAAYQQVLEAQGLIGSMGRRANPYDNAKAEDFMKTLRVEAVYPIAYKTFEDVLADLPCFVNHVYTGIALYPAFSSRLCIRSRSSE